MTQPESSNTETPLRGNEPNLTGALSSQAHGRPPTTKELANRASGLTNLQRSKGGNFTTTPPGWEMALASVAVVSIGTVQRFHESFTTYLNGKPKPKFDTRHQRVGGS
jgi:aromatic ring hydroxylase